MQEIFRMIFLLPASWVFRVITGIRNYLYDSKILRSVRFEFPVISIGNLSSGGTGKTPHTEYLILLLQYIYQVATISRGYGRKTSGFKIADENSTAETIGDEPLQFRQNYPETVVCVSEDRVLAVPRLLTAYPALDVILLDDAFQHRAIRAGLSILLTDYSKPFYEDDLLPYGKLREHAANKHRADIIVITKCPADISNTDRSNIIRKVNPAYYQKVYFSYLRYGQVYSLSDKKPTLLLPEMNVLLLTGIANPQPLEEHLRPQLSKLSLLSFPDHHYYDNLDLETIRRSYNQLPQANRCIVTTEKDAARLRPHLQWFTENQIPVLVQPVSIDFLFGEKQLFDADIFKFVEFTKSEYNKVLNPPSND